MKINLSSEAHKHFSIFDEISMKKNLKKFDDLESGEGVIIIFHN